MSGPLVTKRIAQLLCCPVLWAKTRSKTSGRVVPNEFGRYALITVAGLRLPAKISSSGAAL
jgi:hypothetical protein